MPATAMVVISDLHCGSVVGLLPPGFKTMEGNEVGQNKIQRWFWECWQTLPDWINKHIGKREWILALNGDLIDGNSFRSTQIISPDIGDHMFAANESIEFILNACERKPKIAIVAGTESHTGNIENAIGDKFKAIKNPANGKHTFDRLELDIRDCRCNIAHHVSTTSRPYLESGQFSIQLGVERMEAIRNGKKPPQVVCRAHRHVHGVFSDGTAIMAITGAWQALTRYGYKVVPHACPRPSAVLFDWQNQPMGGLPICHEKVFTLVDDTQVIRV